MVETTRFMNSASRSAHGTSAEVYMEPECIEVHAEVGSGYTRESTNVSIPMEVVIRMMEHAGYTVSRVVCPACNNSNNMHGVSCPNGEE